MLNSDDQVMECVDCFYEFKPEDFANVYRHRQVPTLCVLRCDACAEKWDKMWEVANA